VKNHENYAQFTKSPALNGVTILNGEKHTLSNEVAYEATSLLRHHSWETYKNADKVPFLHHLLEK